MAMTIRISRATHAALIAMADANPVQEVCAILFGQDNGIESFRGVLNVARDPSRMFEIDPAALIAAHRATRHGGPAIIGYFHSHPRGPAVPSETDRAYAAADGRLWLIAGMGVIKAWHALPTGFAEDAIELVDNLALKVALGQRAVAITGKATSHDHQ
jgi:desampylase